MQLKHIDFQFTLLTPCFSGTALGKEADHAEMRIPPIRGHVRFWHRVLFRAADYNRVGNLDELGTGRGVSRVLFGAADCNRVWGSASGNKGQGSRVSVRFVGCVSTTHATPEPTLLPHKPNPNQRGPRPALAAGEFFTLRLQRLVGCTNEDWNHAQRAVKLWLLVGGLGLRSNRAAGSVWPIGEWVPRDADSFMAALQDLGLGNWSVALIGEGKNKSADELRETASDTIQGNPHRQIFGGINPRQPSPTKFKVIRLGQSCCLLAVAPHQSVLGGDGQQRPILREAERLLHAKPNPSRWTALGPWNYLLP